MVEQIPGGRQIRAFDVFSFDANDLGDVDDGRFVRRSATASSAFFRGFALASTSASRFRRTNRDQASDVDMIYFFVYELFLEKKKLCFDFD